ncbi:hypothetical protein [Haladaptatus sp.]
MAGTNARIGRLLTDELGECCDADVERVREIRDEIERRVVELFDEVTAK